MSLTSNGSTPSSNSQNLELDEDEDLLCINFYDEEVEDEDGLLSDKQGTTTTSDCPAPPTSTAAPSEEKAAFWRRGRRGRGSGDNASSSTVFWNTKFFGMSSLLDTVLRRKTPSVKNSLAVVGLRMALIIGRWQMQIVQ